MHRRPLGHGRILATLGGVLMVVGCILPWWQVGGTPGITPISDNGMTGTGIVVFLAGIATLALVLLPYAAGDKPVGLDRPLSFAILAVAGWIAYGWRVIELARLDAFQFSTPAALVTNGPGLWISAIGLIILSRATWTMTREPTYR